MKQTSWAFALAFLLLAATPSTTEALTYSRKSELVVPISGEKVSLFDGRFTGGASIAAGDVNGDGVEEWIVGAGPGGGPSVQIIDASGQTIDSWFAYKKNMFGGIMVAAADLDADGRDEVITAPQGDLASEIRVFSAGQLVRAFLAFPSSYHEGVNLTAFPADDKGPSAIIVGTRGLRKNEVRVYSAAGRLQWSWLTDVARDVESGVTVAAGWSKTWDERVIILGAGRGSAPRVLVYGFDTRQNLSSWFAFNKKSTHGVNVAFENDQVVVSPQGHTKPVTRTFNATGEKIRDLEVFESTFRGGVNIALSPQGGAVVLAAVPTAARKNESAIGQKKILVDLSDQKLMLYEGSKLVSTRRISSGKWSTPTPIGTFKTKNKITLAYSKPYKLYMEHWMAFTPDGKYGLHSLPFWKTKNGGRLYEGTNHIGTPVSHGCIRQTVSEAKSLFDWAPIGTPVVIQK